MPAPRSAISSRVTVQNPIMDVSGLPNRGRDAIRQLAENLKDNLIAEGFQVELQHSGSIAGPSSYLKIFDPITGRFFSKQVRISGHSKGVLGSSVVIDIGSKKEADQIVQLALDMRNLGESSFVKRQKLMQDFIDDQIKLGVKPKRAYAMAREKFSETPKENPMKRKPTPAQIAARERFAEMARSGAFKRKRNPAKKTVSQKISQLTREGYPQKQAVAIALSEQRAGKVKRNPIEKHLGGTTYGIIREEVFGYGDKRYRAMIVQKSKTGVPGEVATDLLDAKSFKTKAGAERFLESYGRKRNPRASNPIILVSDKPIVTKRKSNPAKPKRQRMLNISWLTAGGQREIMSVPIEFVFTHYVGNVAEKFFVRTENGQLIVSEYSTGGRIGQVPYTMRAAALNDREAAKRYVAEMLSKIGAERFKTAVKKFDPIN